MKLYANENNPFFPRSSWSIFNMFLLSELNDWILTDNIEEAEVIPSLGERDTDYSFIKNILKPSQILMVLNIFHNDNHLTPSFFRKEIYDKLYKNHHERTIIVHTNLYDDSIDPRFVCFDFMFNREKFFCTHPERKNHITGINDIKCFGMHLAPENTYEVKPVQKKFNVFNKHFLSLNRAQDRDPTIANTISQQQDQRRSVATLLRNLGSEKSYLSDPFKGFFIKTNGWDEDTARSSLVDTSGGCWYPAADYYYDTSYVSVYIESVVDNVMSPSEKTFDPLIKGNFVLGYSTPGTIKYCKELYGFRFPEWIDYTYDNVFSDEQARFASYLTSIKKIAAIPLEELHNLYIRDKHILDHNQRIFYDRPYDNLHTKIVNSAKRMEWLLP